MRWVPAQPNQSYLEYAALRRAYEAYAEQLKKTSPEAMRRFHEWRRNSDTKTSVNTNEGD